jgi:hypothetical protein
MKDKKWTRVGVVNSSGIRLSAPPAGLQAFPEGDFRIHKEISIQDDERQKWSRVGVMKSCGIRLSAPPAPGICWVKDDVYLRSCRVFDLGRGLQHRIHHDENTSE